MAHFASGRWQKNHSLASSNDLVSCYYYWHFILPMSQSISSTKWRVLKTASDSLSPPKRTSKADRTSLPTSYNQPPSPNLQIHSPTDISERISQIRPFAVHHEFPDLQSRLNEVYILHRSPKQDQQNKFLFQSKLKRKCRSNLLQDTCKDIISRKSQNYFRKTNPAPAQQSIRSKTVQEGYDDVQCEIANQLITESRKESKLFRATLTKFHSMIENAEVDYLRRGDVNINPEEVRKYGGFIKLAQKDNVCLPYCDPLPETQRPTRKRARTELYDLNKNDYYTWLKSENKFINIERLKVQINEANRQQKQASHCVKSNKASRLLYSKYFKNNTARKTLLKSSLQFIK